MQAKGSPLGNIKIRVETDGVTKILKVTEQRSENQLQRRNAFRFLDYKLPGETPSDTILEKALDITLKSICLSLIHRRRELATIFVSKVVMNVVESPHESQIKFSVDYFQIDN